MFMRMLMQHKYFMDDLHKVMDFPHQNTEARVAALVHAGVNIGHAYGVHALVLYYQHLMFRDPQSGDYLMVGPRGVTLPDEVEAHIDGTDCMYTAQFSVLHGSNSQEVVDAIVRLANASTYAADRDQAEDRALHVEPKRLH